MVRFDLDELIARVKGRRTAVVTGPAGFLPGVGAFAEFAVRALPVRGFLALEHGLRGELQDGVRFDRYSDPRSGLPVFSFYGTSPTFPADFLRDEVDVVVFHVQDVSHRAYTYKQALAATLEAAAGTRTAVIVLDRPTPLAHLGAWGPPAVQFFPLPLPVGIPLTLGELALVLREKKGLDVDLAVIPARDWDRGVRWSATGLPWVPPSPNVPSVDSAYAYACTGILQATNVSEGRGTCKPFEYIGAPFVAAALLVEELNALGLPGVLFREVWFQPGFNKYAGQVCAGVHLIFVDPTALDPLRTQLYVLRSLARLCPDRFELKAGFGHWLGDEAWTPERLRELDIPGYTARASAAATRFMADTGPARLYAGG
ncbi:MAG: DUF1343 domain-containing protein [Kiritimatiellaeota bacterium]|nr:DUF1343 domain-containing protein [Kiritimatiellota bacterium]